MKYAILFSAVLGLATAQNLAGQPACASPCLSSAIQVAGCALADEGCQCGTGKSSIQAAVATCLIAGCQVADLLLAQKVGNELCLAYSSTAGILTIQTSTGPLTTTRSVLNGTQTATTSLAATTGTSPGATVIATATGGLNGTFTANTSPATTSPPSSSRAATTSHSSHSSSAAAASSSSAAGAVAKGAAGVGLGGFAGLVLGLLAAL